MKRLLLFIICLVILWIPATGLCQESTGHINFAIGSLRTADDFSKAFGLNDRIEIGVNCDVKMKKWPISIAISYMLSYGDSETWINSNGNSRVADVDAYFLETYIGVRKNFNYFNLVRPYINGGLYSVNMYIDISHDNKFKSGIGGWAGAGAYIALTKRLNIGLEWRWSQAKVNAFDTRFNTGGSRFNLLFGFDF